MVAGRAPVQDRRPRRTPDTSTVMFFGQVSHLQHLSAQAAHTRHARAYVHQRSDHQYKRADAA